MKTTIKKLIEKKLISLSKEQAQMIKGGNNGSNGTSTEPTTTLPTSTSVEGGIH